MKIILCILLTYLMGSIPFGYLIGRLMGEKDIREKGSGNIGATNTLRVLGKKAGAAVFALDFLKGFLAVKLGLALLGGSLGLFCSLVPAALGHSYPVWLGFRGGKGVAVSVGGLIGLSLWYGVIALAVFIAVVAVTGYVSLGSILGTIVGGLLIFVFTPGIFAKLAAVIVVALVVGRHHGNISRLIKGEERHISLKKK